MEHCSVPAFSNKDWNTMEIISALSIPMTTLTEQLSGDEYPTLSLVLPAIICCEEQVIAVDVSKSSKAAKAVKV